LGAVWTERQFRAREDYLMKRECENPIPADYYNKQQKSYNFSLQAYTNVTISTRSDFFSFMFKVKLFVYQYPNLINIGAWLLAQGHLQWKGIEISQFAKPPKTAILHPFH
jgi:hypothetical protein